LEQNQAAARVAEALWSAEAALDDAFKQMAALLGAMTQARQDANWSFMVGQDATNEVAAALPEMTAVRDRIIAAHRRLDRWQKRMGVDVSLFGGGDKGEESIAPADVRQLRAA
jgi:histidyl-tRNA synthetase